MLQGKHIILGVTGSIAAYKAASLIRLMVRQGAQVKVIMTPLAKEFITPLTLATLSRGPILVDFFNPENGDWNNHVALGLWADLYLIAPASANTLAKMAQGVADNLLLTTYLSARCPVMVAPAMDVDMYQHPATQGNIQALAGRGVHIVDAAHGELASGLEGKGRMEEPEQIVAQAAQLLAVGQSMAGLRALVTSGPTHEPIDPVRYIGNHSSGQMGACIALELARRGAQVALISGPVGHTPTHPNIAVTHVQTAQQMHSAALEAFPSCQLAVMAAAVADFTPSTPHHRKLKRGEANLSLQLAPTPDIAQSLGSIKAPNQLLVGFALETDDGVANAQAKLAAKGLDLIVLNSLTHAGAGFGHPTNRVTMIDRNGQVKPFPLKSKVSVANDIVDTIGQLQRAML